MTDANVPSGLASEPAMPPDGDVSPTPTNPAEGPDVGIGSAYTSDPEPRPVAEPSPAGPAVTPKPAPHRFAFAGRGEDYFGIYMVNLLLSLITLTLYRPWARARSLQYSLGQTEFAGSRLTFHGTGEEMFRGYLKLLGLIALIGLGTFLNFYLAKEVDAAYLYFTGFLFALGSITLLFPVALYGMLRYRLSRISWRGIHFGYRGSLNELIKSFFVNLAITFLTFGFYYSWFINNLRKEIIPKMRVGDVRFRYTGKGSDIFGIYIKNYFLWGILFGIVFVVIIGAVMGFVSGGETDNMSFQLALRFVPQLIGYAWAGTLLLFIRRELLQYMINNTKLEHRGQLHALHAKFELGTYLKLFAKNAFFITISLGLYLPFAIVSYQQYFLSRIVVAGNFNPDQVQQTEDEVKDATGDDIIGMLDISFA